MRPRVRLHACPHLHTENNSDAALRAACTGKQHMPSSTPIRSSADRGSTARRTELRQPSEYKLDGKWRLRLVCMTGLRSIQGRSRHQAEDGILHGHGVRAHLGDTVRAAVIAATRTLRHGSIAAAAGSSRQLISPLHVRPPGPRQCKPCAFGHSSLSLMWQDTPRQHRLRSGCASAQLAL